MKTKQSEWMKGLLYAESERKRIEDKGCYKKEIDNHLLNLHIYEDLHWNTTDWLEGFDDYRKAYLRGEIL